MRQYLFTFGISCLFAALANHSIDRKHKVRFVFFSMLSVLSGAFLAGVRASSVGTDVITYGNYIFELACKSDSVIQMFIIQGKKIEPLYLLLNFFVSRFTHDVHWMYFILQLITLSLAYIAILGNGGDRKYTFILKICPNFRGKRNIAFKLMIYYLVFFAFSLNGLRQAIAMSIVLFAYKYIYENNFKKYFITVLIATGFHYSALLFLSLYFLYKYIQNSNNKLFADLNMVCIFLSVIIFSQTLLRIIVVFVPKYELYLTEAPLTFSLKPLIIRIPIILMLFFCYKKYQSKDDRIDFWLVLLIGDVIFIELRETMPALSRLSFYFATAKIEGYSLIDQVFSKKSKFVVDGIIIIFLFAIWYYQIVIYGGESIYPYVSDVFEWIN